MKHLNSLFNIAFLGFSLLPGAFSFHSQKPASLARRNTDSSYVQKDLGSSLYASTTSSTDEMVQIPSRDPTDEWELDCYSRPVVVHGKKLWEVLITDSSGSFRYRKELPSNQVNSKELRKTIDELIDSADVKPSIVRFFRGAMFNMINIALSELDVISRPSRCTFALAQWLEERNKDVYPNMEGYRATMLGGLGPSFLDVRTPVKMPDALRGEKYAFVALPLAEFLPGGDITEENIGNGRLCPISKDLPGDAFVQGVVILTQRSKALASWMAGTEVVGLSCDLRKNHGTRNRHRYSIPNGETK